MPGLSQTFDLLSERHAEPLRASAQYGLPQFPPPDYLPYFVSAAPRITAFMWAAPLLGGARLSQIAWNTIERLRRSPPP